MQRTGRSLSELAAGMDQFPQVLLNVKVREPVDPTRRRRPCATPSDSVESELGGRGRVVLRASGTEPVIRIMVEGEDRIRSARSRVASRTPSAPASASNASLLAGLQRRCVAARRPVSCRPAALTAVPAARLA